MQKALKNAPLNTIVRVFWIDICFVPGWRPLDEAVNTDVLPCESVGYLIAKDENSIKLVMSLGGVALNDNDELVIDGIGETLVIPTCCVENIEVLQSQKSRKR